MTGEKQPVEFEKQLAEVQDSMNITNRSFERDLWKSIKKTWKITTRNQLDWETKHTRILTDVAQKSPHRPRPGT
jgi:hypothetical protein